MLAVCVSNMANKKHPNPTPAMSFALTRTKENPSPPTDAARPEIKQRRRVTTALRYGARCARAPTTLRRPLLCLCDVLGGLAALRRPLRCIWRIVDILCAATDEFLLQQRYGSVA